MYALLSDSLPYPNTGSTPVYQTMIKQTCRRSSRRQPKDQGLRLARGSSDDTSSDGESKGRQDVPLGKAKQVKKSGVGRDSDARSGV